VRTEADIVAVPIASGTTRRIRTRLLAMGSPDLCWGTRAHLAVEGVDVHVEVAAPARRGAPVLVGLHGFASGTFTWAGIAPLLHGDLGFVAWDRPPFGRSGRPTPRRGAHDPYRLEAELGRLGVLVARLAGPAPVVLVGHSAGALLAVQAVLAGVVRAAGLVLIAPAVEGGPPPAVRAVSRVPGTTLVATSMLRVGALGAGSFLRRSTRHPSPLTEATAAETARVLRRPGTATALWHLTTTWQPPAVLHRLDEVRVPAVVIGGIDDRIVTIPAHRAVAEGLGAELHLLESAGHAPHEQRPDEVAGIVQRFVDDLGGR
jgi:magnesium chelatase accessory protein